MRSLAHWVLAASMGAVVGGSVALDDAPGWASVGFGLMTFTVIYVLLEIRKPD